MEVSDAISKQTSRKKNARYSQQEEIESITHMIAGCQQQT
jgi:hypothetical protein